jgi:hypothetical protein
LKRLAKSSQCFQHVSSMLIEVDPNPGP